MGIIGNWNERQKNFNLFKDKQMIKIRNKPSRCILHYQKDKIKWKELSELITNKTRGLLHLRSNERAKTLVEKKKLLYLAQKGRRVWRLEGSSETWKSWWEVKLKLTPIANYKLLEQTFTKWTKIKILPK